MKLHYVLGALILSFASQAAAQQPLATPPTSPLFLPRFDFHLSAAALANDDPRFSWDTHFGGDVDVVDYVFGRTAAIMDYEAVLGNELRAFDPNQGNYILELSTSLRVQRTEVAAIFHHVSRHLSDRPKVIPVAWNILGVRALRQVVFNKTTIDLVGDFGGTTQKVNVDYRWSGNADVVLRRELHRHAAVYGRGFGHLMAVEERVRHRHTQTGGGIEVGLRLIGEAAAGELFAGFERRFDAHVLDFKAQRWFMVGFRVVRR